MHGPPGNYGRRPGPRVPPASVRCSKCREQVPTRTYQVNGMDVQLCVSCSVPLRPTMGGGWMW